MQIILSLIFTLLQMNLEENQTCVSKIYFFSKIHAVGAHYSCLIVTILMSTQNINKRKTLSGCPTYLEHKYNK